MKYGYVRNTKQDEEIINKEKEELSKYNLDEIIVESDNLTDFYNLIEIMKTGDSVYIYSLNIFRDILDIKKVMKIAKEKGLDIYEKGKKLNINYYIAITGITDTFANLYLEKFPVPEIKDTDISKINNCPVCGCKAVLKIEERRDSQVKYHVGFIQCTNCGIRSDDFELDHYYYRCHKSGEIIDKWNNKIFQGYW